MVEVDIFIDKIWGKNTISKVEIKKIVSLCLKQTKIEAKNVFLNVSFVNSETIKKINLKYRGKNTTTNVLSFENKENNKNDMLFLGDIVLSYEEIKREADMFNKKFKDRLYHLFIHGILHLLGFDHLKEKERKEMEQLEINILKNFNIKEPYFI